MKEINNIKSIRKIFTCEYCNTLNTSITNGHKCSKCNKVFRNKTDALEHYLLFRVTDINTKVKKVKYNYNDCIKLSKVEVTICIIFIIILISAILGTLLK